MNQTTTRYITCPECGGNLVGDWSNVDCFSCGAAFNPLDASTLAIYSDEVRRFSFDRLVAVRTNR